MDCKWKFTHEVCGKVTNHVVLSAEGSKFCYMIRRFVHKDVSINDVVRMTFSEELRSLHHKKRQSKLCASCPLTHFTWLYHRKPFRGGGTPPRFYTSSDLRSVGLLDDSVNNKQTRYIRLLLCEIASKTLFISEKRITHDGSEGGLCARRGAPPPAHNSVTFRCSSVRYFPL